MLNEDVVKLAEPLLTGIGSDIGVVPSKNTTVPVAAAGVMVAMNVTDVPALIAVVLTVCSRSTSVAALSTFCANAAETDPLKFASPLY